MIEEWVEYDKPKYNIRVKLNERHLWPVFSEHHYMSGSLASGASFYTFYLYKDGKETLFGCLGVVPQIAKIPARRITRLVILPEYQGLSLAGPMINNIGAYYHSKGIKLYSATFHPRLGTYQEKSNLWSPSAHNMKAHKVNDEFFDDSLHNGLRDGVAMYRYHYNPEAIQEEIPKFKLIYDPLALAALKTKRKHNPSQELTTEIREFENKIKEMQAKIYGRDLTIITDKESEETKEKMQKIFKRPKRRTLTAKERKELKQRKKDGK